MTDLLPRGDRPLLVTADPALLEDLLRLTAGAGVEADVAAHPRAARPVWQTAPLVLVGRDLAAALSEVGLPRRRDVVLVGVGADEQDPLLWRDAVTLGAERVVLLPEGERRLVETMAAAERSDASGTVVAVVGGRGGAGASVLAAALCLAAVRSGRRPLLVDADPWGGRDLLLGAEDVEGLRWPDLAGLAGTVSGPSSAMRRPARGRQRRAVGPRRSDGPAGVGRGVGPRCRGALARPRRRRPAAAGGRGGLGGALPRVDDLLVVPAEVRAAAAAARARGWLLPGSGARLVVRTGRGRSVEPELIASALGVPLAAVVSDEARLAADVDAGDPPGARPRASLARIGDGS